MRTTMTWLLALALLAPAGWAQSAPAPAAKPAPAPAQETAPGERVAAAKEADGAGGAGTARDAEAAAAAAAATAEALASGSKVLARMVVLGASASNGINLPAGFAEALGLSVAAEHEAPLDVTSVMFFMQGEGSRKALVKKALDHKPSAVIGLDFLFWYGYGVLPEEARLPLLEQGLALLDGFLCPVVVSEFPDMSPAVGKMLMAQQVPAPETLAALNERLRAWAAERPQVILVPLAPAIERMRAGEAITVGGNTWLGGDESRFLLPDKLHPTPEGLVVMACLVAEGLRARVQGLKPEDFVSDPAAILAAYEALVKDRPPRSAFKLGG
jgi:hypothetical protein